MRESKNKLSFKEVFQLRVLNIEAYIVIVCMATTIGAFFKYVLEGSIAAKILCIMIPLEMATVWWLVSKVNVANKINKDVELVKNG